MNGDDLTELLRLRHDVLAALCDEPRPRHELVEELSGSKSTIYKGLSQLQEAGLVERTDEGFSPTLYGTVSLARYDSLTGIARFEELLTDYPGAAVDPAALVGAEVIRPDETDVERHIERLWDLLDGAETAHGVSPIVSPGYVERFLELLEGGLSVTLVLPKSIVDSLRADYPAELAAVSERARLYETNESIPFGVVLTRGANPRMAIELRDGPLITGLIVNDTPNALRWAEETVDQFRRTAARVEAER